MNDLERVKELLDIAKKNNLFNMTTYDFAEFEINAINAFECYGLTDCEKHRQMLEKSNIKFVYVESNIEKDLDDHLYLATYASGETDVIMVYEFCKDGSLFDTYIADACSTLEEFKLA